MKVIAVDRELAVNLCSKEKLSERVTDQVKNRSKELHKIIRALKRGGQIWTSGSMACRPNVDMLTPVGLHSGSGINSCDCLNHCFSAGVYTATIHPYAKKCPQRSLGSRNAAAMRLMPTAAAQLRSSVAV